MSSTKFRGIGFSFASSKSISKSELWFRWIRHRHRSCILFILPIECLVQNIQINRRCKNLDLIKETILVFYFVFVHFWTFVSVLNFVLAFLTMFSKCLAKLSLLSVVTNNTFSCLLFLRVLFPYTRPDSSLILININ